MMYTELLDRLGWKVTDQGNNPAVDITGIEYDSRHVSPGNLFFAVKGANFDGHDYIECAIQKGAAAVVGSKAIPDIDLPYIQVEDTREALAQFSAAFYGFPAREMNVIGVTGTDGKTTTVNLIYQTLLASGLKAGMISTVNAVAGEEVIDTGFHVTTPEAPTIQSLLRKMADHGLTHVVLEATSHGLDQRRVSACEFDIAIVTNITHEHFDYHGDYNAYFNAKFRLIEELLLSVHKPGLPQRTAVINYDDISFNTLNEKMSQPGFESVRLINYGIQPGPHVFAEDIKADAEGVRFNAVVGGISYPVSSHLIGEYNVQNILAAITATALGLGLEMESVVLGIECLESVSGRMERIDLGQGFLAIVDFAHTPNALKVALQTAKKMTKGRVISVFGSAGLRDKQKRRMMAAESLLSADISIITAEDPRTEDLEDLLNEMADEARKNSGIENRNFYTIADRGDAIRKAVNLAQSDDLVIACGKGHEQSMCFGETEYPWDDRVAMQAALSELMNIPGPRMPYLPTQGKEKTGGS